MKTDEQLKQNFKVFLGKDDVIYDIIKKIEQEDKESTRAAELEEQALKDILKQNPDKKFYFLVDLLAIPKEIKYMSSGARKVYSGIMANKQIKKTGIAGQSLFFKVMASFLSAASGSTDKVK